MKYNYLIIGAGLTGSLLAYELNKIGAKVLVVDKRNHIGGNIYTETSWEIPVHKYGPHVFHTDEKWVWDYINQFATFIPYIQETLANYKDEIYNLPFNLNTFKQIYKENDSEKCIELLEKDIKENYKANPTNLEEQAINLVGPKIYKKLIKGYTEKQWDKKCTELDPSIIKRLPVRHTFDNNYFNDRYQGIPKGGYTQIIEKMLEGIELKLNFDYNKHKDEIDADKIIHTGMIDEYYDYCFGNLEYRSLRFEEQWLPYFQYQSHPVINYTDKDIPWTRIIEHKHFEKLSTKCTIITKEFPEKYEIGKEAYYPINNEINNNLYLKYLELAKKDNIIFCGRLGSYKYLDMDDTIVEAFKILNIL